MSKAVLVDITKCMACRGCQVACKQWNELPAERTGFTGGSNPGDISAKTWTRIDFHPVTLADGAAGLRYVKSQCFHCEEPACVSACPVAALTRTEEGPVIYDDGACIGCRYCLIACPFSVPSFEWEKQLSLMRKCDMCYDRISAGMEPACVATCPAEALTFGDRDELIARARTMIADRPATYVDHIYGEDEVGGLAWLYISDTPFDQLGMRTDLGTRPMPAFTWDAMLKVPWVAAGGTLFLTGLYWYTDRRNKLAAGKEE